MNDKPVEPFQIWMHLSEAVNKLEVAMSKCNFLPAQVMMYQEVPGTHECDMRMVEFRKMPVPKNAVVYYAPVDHTVKVA